MKNYTYKVVKDENTNEFFHAVYERSTNQIIESFFFEDDCQEYMEFLNKGGGFSGFTPSFILNKIIPPKDLDVNTKFDKYIS